MDETARQGNTKEIFQDKRAHGKLLKTVRCYSIIIIYLSIYNIYIEKQYIYTENIYIKMIY